MWRRPVVLLFLLVCCGSLEARGRDGIVGNVETVRRDARETAPLAFATEVADLLGEGNSPGKQEAPKKIMKNSSGTLFSIALCIQLYKEFHLVEDYTVF